LLDAASSTVNENRASRSTYHVAVDLHGARFLLPCFTLHSGRFARVDIREEVQPGSEIAVADGGDGEIPDSLTWKGKVDTACSPQYFLVSGVNV
jgi:hypothetical protein